MRVEVVLIVGAEFLKASASHIQQLYLHLRACLSVLAALHDVLLAGACGLHHLVNGAVAVGREEAMAELHRQLIDCIALTVEVKLLPDDRFLQDLAFSVVFHSLLFF